MPAFEFRSLDHRGKVKRGTLEADSARHVRQQLRGKGWVPLEVSEAKDHQSGGGLSARLSGTGKLKGGELDTTMIEPSRRLCISGTTSRASFITPRKFTVMVFS